MDKIKYLIFIVLITYSKLSYSSPWLVPKNNIEYAFGFYLSNNVDYSNAQSRIYQDIQNTIDYYHIWLNRADNQYEYWKINNKIKKLKKQQKNFYDFYTVLFNNHNIEYGIKENLSIGVGVLVKKIQNFKMKNYIIPEYSFYPRILLYKTYNKTLSWQPKLILSENNIFTENRFLFGQNFKRNSYDRFSTIEIAHLTDVNLKPIWKIDYTHGLKYHKWTLMLQSFKAYRTNISNIYRFTLNEQISVINNVKHNMYLQLGYFKEFAPRKIINSGIFFSLWIKE